MRKIVNAVIGAVLLAALSCAGSRASGQEFADYYGSRTASEFDDQARAEEEFALASWLQQPGVRAPAPTLSTAPRTTQTSRQSGLASVPNMFGDCGPTTANITILRANGATTDAQFMLPVIGGARTAKIAENGVALPTDRIFFNYNHFHNIFQMQSQTSAPPGPLLARQEPIDRYTIGFEKTFFDGLTSIELRMPFNGAYDASLPGLSVSNGNIGNLGLLFKALLYEDDALGIGVGLGLDTPTGTDTIARLGTVNLQFQNDALHILPYIGFMYSPGDPIMGWGDTWFMSGFMQFDATASGNNVQFVDPGNQLGTSLGQFNEQNVMYFDLAVGYWIYRDPDAYRLTGLAIVGEAHYITAVQDADLVAGTANGAGAVVTNTLNRFDVVNGVVALEALLFDTSSLRVGGVFPMGQADDKRFFDAEVQVQFNRRF
jgi:hypothetical protein